jgi:hypothetical protein
VVCLFSPFLLTYNSNFAGVGGDKGSALRRSAGAPPPLPKNHCGCCLYKKLGQKNWGVKLMEDGGDSGWTEQAGEGHPPPKKRGGVFV